MIITANQLDTYAGLLLDLADIMRTNSCRSPLTHADVRERLRLIEAAGDPLGLAARLRALVGDHAKP